MSKLNAVQPFKFWCQKVLPLVYDDSLSYYELLCKVVAHLNNLIETTNNSTKNIAELAEMVAELQHYVNNYFDYLPIENAVNAKLDELVQTGAFVGFLQNSLSLNKPIIALCPNKNKDKSLVMCSYDGIEFRTLYEFPYYYNDPSYMYVDGIHVIAYTSTDSGRDFRVLYSTDLKTWALADAVVGAPKTDGSGGIGVVYAPDLFEMNGQLYYAIAVQSGVITDPYGLISGTIPKQSLYYGTWAIENGVPKFNQCIKANSVFQGSSYIDPDFYFDGVNLWLNIKDEGERLIEIYKGTNFDDLVYQRTIPLRGIEGGEWFIDNNGNKKIYFDCYSGSWTVPFYGVYDYETQEIQPLKTDSVLRHGCFFVPTSADWYNKIKEAGALTSQTFYCESNRFNVTTANHSLFADTPIYTVVPDMVIRLLIPATGATLKIHPCNQNRAWLRFESNIKAYVDIVSPSNVSRRVYNSADINERVIPVFTNNPYNMAAQTNADLLIGATPVPYTKDYSYILNTNFSIPAGSNHKVFGVAVDSTITISNNFDDIVIENASSQAHTYTITMRDVSRSYTVEKQKAIHVYVLSWSEFTVTG